MSTLVQLIKTRKSVSNICVVTGPNLPLRQWAFQVIQEKTKKLYNIEEIDEKTLFDDHILPVILWSEKRGPNPFKRWLPDDGRVTFIDCGEGDKNELETIARACGATKEGSVCLVTRTNGDVTELRNAIRILSYFHESWETELIERTFPTGDLRHDLRVLWSYGVKPSATTRTACRVLRKRLELFSRLNDAKRYTHDRYELANRSRTSPWKIDEYLELIKYTKLDYWFSKLPDLALAEEAVNQNQPLVKEFLYSILIS